MAKSPNLSRNDFVKGVVGMLGGIMGVVVGIPAIGFVLAPALKISSADVWIPLGPLENYPVGTPTPLQLYPLESQWLGENYQQLWRLSFIARAKPKRLCFRMSAPT